MFDAKERRFVATLWEDYDPDDEDEDRLEGGGDVADEDLAPVEYELVEYGDEDEEPTLRRLVSASGATMVKALL